MLLGSLLTVIVVYKVVLLFNKMSVVCLYYRIFAIITTSFRIACHVMSKCLYRYDMIPRAKIVPDIWIVTTGIAFTLATIFQCTPIAAFWDHSIEGAKCFHNQPWWISYATVQIITDFVLLAMPFRQILKLSMGTTEKLGVALVFGTGGLYVLRKICSRRVANSTKRNLCVHLSRHDHCNIRKQPRSNLGSHSRDNMVRHRSECRYHLRLSSNAPRSIRTLIWTLIRLARSFQSQHEAFFIPNDLAK